MATINSTSKSTTNDAAYVAGNQLADAAMFITSTMRLIEREDGEAYCLLAKAQAEIIAAQDYLESIDPIELPICAEIANALNRIALGN